MRLFILLIMSFVLIGCASEPEKIVVTKPVIIPVVCEDPGRIDPVEALPVVFVEGTDKQGNVVLGLRGDQYSNLSIVIRDTLRYIKEQKDTIAYYRGCIERHNSSTLNNEGEPN